MPRNKKGSLGGARGRNRGRGGHSQKSKYNVDSDDDAMDFIPFAAAGVRTHENTGFSLASEARGTPARHNWSSDTKLRNTKVNFVSAGPSLPATLQELQETSPTQRDVDSAKSAELTLLTDSTASLSAQQDTPVETEEDDVLAPFVIDTVGDESVIPLHLPMPRIRSTSPTPSDSSEDVILFTGRDTAGRGKRRTTPPKHTSSKQSPSLSTQEARLHATNDQINSYQESSIVSPIARQLSIKEPTTAQLTELQLPDPNRITLDEFRSLLTYPQGESVIIGQDAASAQEEVVTMADSDPVVEDRSQKGYQSHSRSKRGRGTSSRNRDGAHTQRLRQDADEEAIIDDYIANMEEDELSQMLSVNIRVLGGEEDDVWQESTDSATEAIKSIKTSDWSREDLCDFDDLSTSDGVMESISVILSKRERSLGQQYLVVWDDQAVDEARWHYHHMLPTDHATVTLIAEFEAEERLVAEFFDAESDVTDGESADELDGSDAHGTGDSDDIDDEADLVQRRIDRMTDEKIARLLAKQEELGMGSDQLVLFDDSDDEVDGHDTFEPSYIPLTYDRSQSATRRSAKPVRNPNTSIGYFPRATALADAYDGFDVMDFDRPSLKKKTKGRKSTALFDDVSDSDTAAAMQMTWENDRLKKKARKEERQELRALGLLGKKNREKPDMRARYKEGMSIGDVKEAIRTFLQGHDTTLALPPMAKADRKIVHELGSAFNLKSKSTGGGKKRFPILYRTQRTSVYDEAIFSTLESKISRRFMPRMDIGSKRQNGGTGRAGRGGGFASSAVGYRDGDVVGSSAPELSAENRGRKMLEMMGWSAGDALGALNNKGILQPITHVVKTTKAGLG